MDLPLPTDNLYKFLALAGIALVLLGYVVPHDKANELERRVAEIEAQKLVFLAELKVLDKDTSRASKQKDVPAEELKDLGGRLLEVKRKFAEIDGAELQANTAKAQMEREKPLFHIFTILGALFSVLGFVLWYVVVQRPSDLITKLD